MVRNFVIAAALLASGTAHAALGDWQCAGSRAMDMRQVPQAGPAYRIAGTLTRAAPDLSKARGNNAVVYIRLAGASVRDKVELNLRGAGELHAYLNVFQNYEQTKLDLGPLPIDRPVPFELKVGPAGGSVTLGGATRNFALALSGPVTAMIACSAGDYDFAGIEMGAGAASNRPDGLRPGRSGGASPPATPMPDWAKGRRRGAAGR